MPRIELIPHSEFARVRAPGRADDARLALVADMCRFNTIAAVKLAGSGHLGSSFSAMDIVVWLYFREMNTLEVGVEHPDRDVYFSSKGHDVPGLYAVLTAGGVLPEEKLRALRRFGGLDGHPDVGVRGIETNSGSLGMGISKGRGMLWAKRRLGRGGRVFVLTGDGELQEGQNYEALQTTAHQRVNELVVIVDHNKLQTDRTVAEITDLRDLERKVAAFGWHVRRCDGHDFAQLERTLRELEQLTDRPKMIIADTVKGRGVSFMEHPRALAENKGLYPWHAGAPADDAFERARDELRGRIDEGLERAGLAPLQVTDATPAPAAPSNVAREFVADAYGAALLELAEERDDVVVLDGDLAVDCRVRAFEERYPDRFIENGIAEQDMVSMAGGIARQGLLPVVNSFASFLAARANEQIYNNATEHAKIIYACHYAGLIPAGPGKSHQSVRDISLFVALPESTIVQPCNPAETRLALRWLVENAKGAGVIRLAIGPSPRRIELPSDYRFEPGRGTELAPGDDAIMFAYGPVLLHEALSASEILRDRGFGLRVVNMPWLNRVDEAWLARATADFERVYVVDDHSVRGGLGDRLAAALARTGRALRVERLGVQDYPACGTPPEALRFHRLDGESLAERVLGEAIEARAGVALAGAYTAEAPQ